MSAMLALLHLNFSDSSLASLDERQAASTGHQRIDFLLGKVQQVCRSQFCCGQVLITHPFFSVPVFFSKCSLFQAFVHYVASKPQSVVQTCLGHYIYEGFTASQWQANTEVNISFISTCEKQKRKENKPKIKRMSRIWSRFGVVMQSQTDCTVLGLTVDVLTWPKPMLQFICHLNLWI